MCDFPIGAVLQRTPPFACNLPFNVTVLAHEKGFVSVRSMEDTTGFSIGGYTNGQQFKIPCGEELYHIPRP